MVRKKIILSGLAAGLVLLLLSVVGLYGTDITINFKTDFTIQQK
jgi:hypothetical protein